MIRRRELFALTGVAAVLSRASVAQSQTTPTGVITPNGESLPMRVVNGVKVGHLVASAFDHEFTPGLRAECWGYNGRTPGPTIELVEGDRVRLYVTNRLPEATTVHWHGVPVPNGMDGVSGLNQKPIPPGETYVYDFVARRAGTYMYHSHADEMVQIALGLVGMFIVHPRAAARVDRDFAIMLHEWSLKPGMRRPDPLEMTDFNLFTFNGKAYPSTDPLVVTRGDRVRIRLGNLSPMDHHPIHLHGLHFKVTATDGGNVPEAAQWPEATVLVPVGAVRVIELVADEPGDWAMHCHMTHHVMTQMGHGLPNMIGAATRALDARLERVEPHAMTMGQTGMSAMSGMAMPGPTNSVAMQPSPGPYGPIDMGGMLTIVKVRERGDASKDYAQPPGTRADKATAAQMQADGIDPAVTSGAARPAPR